MDYVTQRKKNTIFPLNERYVDLIKQIPTLHFFLNKIQHRPRSKTDSTVCLFLW